MSLYFKKMGLFLTFWLTLGLCSTYPFLVAAETLSLQDTLAHTYQYNPEILAARSELHVAEEKIETALGGYRPSITASAQGGRSATKFQGNPSYPTTKDLQPASMALDITQPLFHGFKTSDSVHSAKAATHAQQAAIKETEQQILFDAAQAYFDIIEAQEILALTRENETVLQKQLAITRDRLRVGELKKTDVSQAEARYQAMVISGQQAERDYVNKQATFQRIVGIAPPTLTPTTLAFEEPTSSEEVLEYAANNNPSIIKARYNHEASDADISAAQGELWPQVDLIARGERAWDQSVTTRDRQDTASVMLRVSIPLYQGGTNYSRIRSARHINKQRQQQLTYTQQQVQETAANAWHNLKTAEQTILGRLAVVTASKNALVGVRMESKYGTRTVLDVLNAEQDLLNAKINNVKAVHDKNLAVLQLKIILGTLTANAFDQTMPQEKQPTDKVEQHE